MATTSSSLTTSGTRFNDPLKGLQEEFELLSNASPTSSSRPSRVIVYLQRLKGEFNAMAVEIDSFQKEREEYETLIEAQAKELADVRRKVVCEKCGEGTASARGTLDRPTTSGGVHTTGNTGHSRPPSLMQRLLQPFGPPRPTSHYTTFQPVVQSDTTNLTSPLPGGSKSIFATMILNDEVENETPARQFQPTTSSQPVVQSPTTNLTTSNFDAIIFNDEVEKEIDVKRVHTLSHPRSIRCVKFSRDGKYVAAGCEDGKAYIYDVQTGNSTCTFCTPSAPNYTFPHYTRAIFVLSLCFSHDGQFLATTSSSDFCVYIWEINKKELGKTFKGHTHYVNSVDFSPNGRLIVSASYDSTVRLWNNGIAKILNDDIHTVPGSYTSAVFSPDGTHVAASHSSGTVRIWEVHSGQLVRRVDAHMGLANSVRFMPDGEGLVSGGDLILRLWDVRSLSRTGSPELMAAHKREFSGHEGVVWSPAISPDGRWVASGSYDKTVRIWDTRNAAEKCVLAHDHYVLAVDFSPAGGYLASGGSDRTVVIWRYSNILPRASGLDGSDLLPSALP